MRRIKELIEQVEKHGHGEVVVKVANHKTIWVEIKKGEALGG